MEQTRSAISRHLQIVNIRGDLTATPVFNPRLSIGDSQNGVILKRPKATGMEQGRKSVCSN